VVDAAGLLVLRKLPGTSLLDVPSPEPAQVADQLGGLLEAIHGVPADALAGLGEPDRYPLTSYRSDAAESMPTIAALLNADQRAMVETFLARAPPPEPTDLVFSHNDLGAEHLLADEDRVTLTGVIDWSDAAIDDPALDLGRILRDLGPGPAARALASLRHEATTEIMARAVFHARCALLEDLAYGRTTGDHRYTNAALDNLERTFGDR
jgi:aminoglycoside phosphotransferase (APT) family kinase protein